MVSFNILGSFYADPPRKQANDGRWPEYLLYRDGTHALRRASEPKRMPNKENLHLTLAVLSATSITHYAAVVEENNGNNSEA